MGKRRSSPSVPPMNGNVHRFRGYVAISTPSGQTEYVSPEKAREFARAILECADDIDSCPFVASSFGSRTIHMPDARRED